MKRRTKWQDWSTLAIGSLLFLSPFALAASNAPRCTVGNTAWFYAPSTLDAWVAGILLIGVSVLALANPGSVATVWARIVLGVWLVFVPWILGFMAGGADAWTSWIAGVLVIALAFWQLVGMLTARPAAPSL